MKLYKKIIAMLLALLMLTSFAACNNGGDGKESSVGDNSEELSSVEESSESDEERAARLYAAAVEALEEKTDIKQSITSTVTRTIGKDVFEIITESTVIRKDGKLYVSEKNEIDSQIVKNEKFFADGKYMYLADKAEDYYYKEMDAKAVEDMLIPVVLLDYELYESLSFDGEDESTFVLTNATAAEAWMAPEYAIVKTVEGKIKLDGEGEISAYEYTAEYTQGPAEYKAEYSVTLSAPEEKDEIKLPEGEGVLLDSIELIDTLEIAYIATSRLTSFDYGYKLDMYSQPGTVGYVVDEKIYTYGKGKDDFLAKLTSNIEYIVGGQSQSSSSESIYKDGKLTTTTDGEDFTESATMEDILDYVKESDDGLSMLKPDMTLFESFEIKDLEDYWYISYKLNEEGSNGLEDYISEFFYEDSDMVDELADAYKAEKAEGFISIDKDTLIISAAGIDFECVHTLDGTEYKSAVQTNISYAVGTVSTYEEITGELPEEEEPEEKARPLFYKVTSAEGKTMYLLGTIHIGDSKTAYLPKEIYDALDASDALAVEVDIVKYEEQLETNAELLAAYLKGNYYEDNTIITDHIDEELYNEALPYILTTGMSAYLADHLTPYAWSDSIEALYIGSIPHLSLHFGVDRRLIKLAGDKEIKIYDVEDPKEHLGMAGSFSEEIHEVLLKSTLSNARHIYIKDTDEMYTLWCEGDEKALTEYIRAEEYPEDATEEELKAMKEYDKMLVADRDAIMVEKAKEYLASEETVFFAVGLAHLLSETGLVDTLRADGYTVELVEYAK